MYSILFNNFKGIIEIAAKFSCLKLTVEVTMSYLTLLQLLIGSQKFQVDEDGVPQIDGLKMVCLFL